MRKLTKKIRISGTITALTGLHIGGTNVALSIGGADATVVRNPLTNQPYIPGASLKGKMRSLLERAEGKFTKGITAFGPFVGDADDPICMIFGLTSDNLKNWAEKKYKDESKEKQERAAARPVSRLIVRDCDLTTGSAEKLKNTRTTDMPYTEVKTEVVIDRITSAATPRQLERVPAGAEFDMTLLLNIHEGDKEEELLNKLFASLALVQDDYLGGKGTRGSGAVKIAVRDIAYKTLAEYENDSDWQALEAAIPSGLREESQKKG